MKTLPSILLPGALAVLAALAALPVQAGAPREAPAAPDAWGYTARTSPDPACPFQYVDLALGGTALTLVAAVDGVPAGDDGGAELALAAPFEFYGESATTLVASSNGYLAPGAGLADEDGGHWRSDCPLPAIPDNGRARFARILALAGDLAQGSSGQLLAEHFAQCPRPSATGLAEPCTIVQWRNWTRLGQSDSLDFQAVLYHVSWQVALQYQALPALPGYTVGVQDGGARSALAVACGAAPPVPAASAVCLFDPRFQPLGDPIFAHDFETGGD
jgi:ABC-type amino acid transport substrate-binding protein